MSQVLTMFEKADAEFAELSQKKQILHLDKDKIEKVGSMHACSRLCSLPCCCTVKQRPCLLLLSITSRVPLTLVAYAGAQQRCLQQCT